MTIDQIDGDGGPTIPAWVRTRIYAVTTALTPLLGAYGIATDEKVALWVALGSALLGTGTAVAYRPTKG